MDYVFNSPNGQVMSTEPFTNGNLWYATASYVFLMRGRTDTSALYRGMDDLWRGGSLSRRWDIDENTSIDDYLAASCLPKYAEGILSRGRSRLGFFSCTKQFPPELRQWLWRFPGFWVNAKITMGQELGFIDQVLWALAIRQAAKQPVENCDGWLQSGLMVLNFLDKGHPSPIMSNAVAIWRAAKPKPLWQIMADYITIEDHPLVEAWNLVAL